MGIKKNDHVKIIAIERNRYVEDSEERIWRDDRRRSFLLGLANLIDQEALNNGGCSGFARIMTSTSYCISPASSPDVLEHSSTSLITSAALTQPRPRSIDIQDVVISRA